MFITFIICYVTIICIAFLRKSGKLIISPLFWMFGGWSLILGLYFTSGIEYKYELQFYTFVYIIFILTIFAIFYYIGLKTSFFPKRKTYYEINDVNDSNYLIKIDMSLYFRLALFGLIFWIFDVSRLNNIVYGYRIENFAISIIGVLGNMLSMLSLIVWLYELSYAIRFNSIPPLRSYLSVAIYTFPSFITAGRQNLLIIIISTFITLFYTLSKNKNYKYGKIIKLIIICAVPIFISYLILISNVRSGSSNKQALFELVFNSHTSQELLNTIEKLGSFKEIVLETVYYYSHQISMFEVFFNNYDGSLFFGMYQLHYISRRLPEFMNLNYDYASVFLDAMSNEFGLYSHVWRTAIAAFIIDFGRVGAVVLSAILGNIVGYKKKVFDNSNSIYDFLFLVILCVGAAFSIQYSPFNETAWAYPLFWLMIIPIIEKLRKSMFLKYNKNGCEVKIDILPDEHMQQ